MENLPEIFLGGMILEGQSGVCVYRISSIDMGWGPVVIGEM